MAHIQNYETKNVDGSRVSDLEFSRIIIEKTMNFLRLFLCDTLVKRILSMVLIAAGLPNASITELTGLCDRSVRSLRKALNTDDIEGFFIVGGGGRKRKLMDVEDDIVEEIDNNNYHSRQQIADMILKKFGIKVSLPAVGRLLKKKVSNGLKADHCLQKRM